MTPKQYDYPTAFSHWGEEEDEATMRVLASGRFTMGQEVEAFEEEFARFHDRKHAIMVNSGSSANLVAVAALDECEQWFGPHNAIAPALAWSTTYAPLVQHGIGFTLSDADETWNASARVDIRRHGVPKIIIACSILGNPGYLQEWKEIADEIGAYLIEDNCESLGAYTPEGKLCGTYGDLSTFSLFYSHQISAIEGGVILTDDAGLADRCRIFRAHGWTRDSSDIVRPIAFENEYRFVAFGYNVRPLELHAAIAREQLKKLCSFAVWRRHNASAFRMMIQEAGIPREVIDIPPTRGIPNPFGITFRCQSREARNRLALALREAGIDCRLPTGGSLRLHPYGQPWASQATPVADDIHHRGMFLGNAPFNIIDKLQRAVDVIAKQCKLDRSWEERKRADFEEASEPEPETVGE